MRRSGVECDVVIETALVDMYGKRVSVERAYEAWTGMIPAFVLHVYSKEAFGTFEEMEALGVKPNHVTFVGLLKIFDSIQLFLC